VASTSNFNGILGKRRFVQWISKSREIEFRLISLAYFGELPAETMHGGNMAPSQLFKEKESTFCQPVIFAILSKKGRQKLKQSSKVRKSSS
jgi:hypothetical protein